MYTLTIDHQLTDWDQAYALVKASGGSVYYKLWLKLELTRIRKDPRRMAEIRKDGEGRLSLWVNRFNWKSYCDCCDCRRFIPIERPLYGNERTGAA